MDEEYYPYSQPSISYEDAVKEGVRRIIFTGPTRYVEIDFLAKIF